jgi:hypothetical protein
LESQESALNLTESLIIEPMAFRRRTALSKMRKKGVEINVKNEDLKLEQNYSRNFNDLGIQKSENLVTCIDQKEKKSR